MKVDKTKWEKVRLEDVCLPKLTMNWKKEKHSFSYIDLASVSIDTHKIGEVSLIDASSAPSRAKQIVKEGDVLFGTTRPLQKRCCLVPRQMNDQICSTGFCVFRPNMVKISSNWAYYCLLSSPFYEYLSPLQKGVTYPAVSDKDVLNYSCYIPTLPEQQAIAAELDAIQSVIDKLHEQLRDYDTLAQSTFNEIFEEKQVETIKLKDACSLMSTGPFGSSLHKSDYVENGTPTINPQDIQGKSIDTSRIACVSENKSEELKRYSLNVGDIVLARRGDLSKCGIISEKERGWLCGTGSFYLRLKYHDPLFFWYYYTSKHTQKILNDSCIGATMPNLNQKILGNLEIPVISEKEQRQFAQRIESIESQKSLLRQQIADARQLMDSRMQYYFE